VPGNVLPSASRTQDSCWCCLPSDESLGYFRSSASRTQSRRLRRIPYYQIKRPRRDFAKAAVAVERNCDADRGIVAGETETAFDQLVVNLVNVKGAGGLAQDHRRRLRNRAIEEAIAVGFEVVSNRRNVVSLGWRMRLKLDLR